MTLINLLNDMANKDVRLPESFGFNDYTFRLREDGYYYNEYGNLLGFEFCLEEYLNMELYDVYYENPIDQVMMEIKDRTDKVK